MVTTFRKLLNFCEEELKQAGVQDADWDAWLILEHCFGLSRSSYFLKRDLEQELPLDAVSELKRLTKERSRRIPLQYLFGTQEFMGLPFLVNEAVLIPRSDTENLVEAVLSDWDGKQETCSVLDVCTGSGCIAAALAYYGRFAAVDAVDLSEAALKVAEQNAETNRVKVRFMQGDLFEPVTDRYDIIVSNPPYITDDVIRTLEPEVKDHEPYMALSGGADGLIFYRRLASESKNCLKPGGSIYLEIGYDQAEAVSGILLENGFEHIRVRKDLAGNDRVVSADLKKGGIQHV
ncbi:MAG: peptide chain release factor N(5)-glutamine methyltransferase [Lachnospiraceae bacterium]|nr:peptide chain release factor N(5)-glutamine methyltransferase [Lachnospiraceae bacterium]